MDYSQEIWKPVKGWEDFYEVSSYGRIWNIRKLKIANLGKGYGYATIGFYAKGDRKSRFTHRVVAENFIPKPHDKHEVNHKNGIRDDNRVENLEWVTHAENIKHAYEVLKRTNGATVVYAKLGGYSPKCIKVNKVSADGHVIKQYNSMKEAVEDNPPITIPKIRKCLKGQMNDINGLIFKLVEGYKMTTYT